MGSMTPKNLTFLLGALTAACTSAFAPAQQRYFAKTIPSSPTQFFESSGTAADRAAEVDIEPQMNPDNPNLPALKGDYDWDAEYAADDDWITENVPGKLVVNEIDLAAQVTELTKIEDRYRKVRKAKEYEE